MEGKGLEKTIGQKAARLLEMGKNGFQVKNFTYIDATETGRIIETQKVSSKKLGVVLEELDLREAGVAVRSSAIGEDGKLSWAGQFDSRLFVKKEDLKSMILECANAQNSETVKAYAKALGLEIPRLTLFIQEMVDADISGVLFTENPLKKDGNMVIELVKGVGESLVSGKEEPVRYFVNPESMDCEMDKNSENCEVFLNDSQINELVLLGTSLSELFDAPQDVEWAIEKGSNKIFIVQSRDITNGDMIDPETIELVRNRVISDTRSLVEKEFNRISFHKDVFSDQNIAEILTTHPCQMAFVLNLYHRIEGSIPLNPDCILNAS